MPFIQPSTMLRIPSCEVQVTGHFEFEFTILPFRPIAPAMRQPESVSLREESRQIKGPDPIKNFKHDFTFEILASRTDIPLSKIFPGIPMVGGEKTPDFARLYEDTLIIVEFMTYHMHEVPAHVWRLKSKKYEMLINERIKEMQKMSERRNVTRRFAYHTIIVTPTKVYSSIQLEQDLINELSARYRFSQQVIEMLRNQAQGLIPPTEEEEERELRLQVEAGPLLSMDFKFAPENTFGISESDYRNFLDELDKSPADRELEQFAEYERLRLNKQDELWKDIKAGKTINFSDDAEYNAELALWKDSFPKETRNHLKCVSNYPLFEVSISRFDSNHKLPDLTIMKCGENPPVELWLWQAAARELYGRVEFDVYDEKIVREKVEEVKENITKVKKTRAKNRRFSYYPLGGQHLELATKGIQGKRYANHPFVLANTKEKKLPLNYDVDTSDIDQWIMKEAEEFYMKEVEGVTKATELKKALIDIGTSIHKAPEALSVADFEVFKYTQGFLYYECLTALGLELAAMIQFNQGPYEWILKKVPDFDLFIIARTVCSSKTVFFSLCLPKRGRNRALRNGPFRKWLEADNFWCTEIVSINESRLQNLVTSQSAYINAFAQWYRFYGGNLREFEPPYQMWSTLAFQMLVHAEDKAMTEEIVTLWRYIEMEKLKNKLTIPKPYKIFKKLPTIFRSRLQIWALHRIVPMMKSERYERYAIAISSDMTKDEKELSSAFESDLPEEEEQLLDQIGLITEGQIVWKGCKNFIDGRPLSGPEKFMEIMYIGYQKNKLEVAPQNQDAKMVAKILKCEEQKRECRKSHMGARDFYRSEDFKMHEFCLKSVVFVADKIKDVLAQVIGPDWQRMICNEVERELFSLSWEKLATLKASSMNYPHIKPVRNKEGKMILPRQRVIERIIDHVYKNESTLLSQLPEIIEYLEELGGIYADIFKKMQHGGLREIYVMIIEGRLIQACIEIFARVVCRYLEIETIVNPDNKTALPVKHAKQREDLKQNKSIFTCNSSNDATTWNQTNYVTKFAYLLCAIFPGHYHPFILRTMELFRKKHILLPPGVIHLLEEHGNTPFTNEVIQRMMYYKAHPTECNFMDFENNQMIIETGFMQGILHINSSLWHAGVLIARECLFRRSLQAKNYPCDVISTDLVSSDDSARMVTVLVPEGLKKADVLRMMLHVISDQELIGVLYKRFGIILSEKSATCTEHAMEFNSEFYFGASLFRAIIKWAIASVVFHEVESLFSRQEAFYNLLQEAIENGCSISQARAIQIAQAFCHYSLIGLNNNDARDFYFNIMVKCPDPAFGFFLMDHPMAVGIAGLKYNYWLLTRNNATLSNRINKLITRKDITTTSAATITTCVAINFGSRIKWRKIVQRCQVKIPDWEQIIEQNPMILYTRPETKEEVLARMMVKLTDPGVTNSLSSTTSLTKMASSAIYIFDHPCIRLGSLWYESLLTDTPNMLTRLSLIAAGRIMAQEDIEVCPIEREREIFPLCDQYREFHRNLNAWCENIDTIILVPSLSSYRHRTKLVVFTDLTESTISLDDICKYKWFGHQNYYSTEMNDEIWASYRAKLPWLRDTVNETLSASPFNNHIQLRNFIAQETSKTRTLNLVGSPFFSTASHSSIVAMISRNFAPGKKIPTSKVDIVRGHMEEIRNVQHALRMVTCGPFLASRKQFLVNELLGSTEPVWRGEQHGLIHTKLMIMSVLQRFVQGEYYDITNLLNDIRKSRRGIIGLFTKFGLQYSARKVERAGETVWDGEIGSVRVRIVFEGDKVKEVWTDDLHRFYQQELAFLQLLKELKARDIVSNPKKDDRRGVVIFEKEIFKITCVSMIGAPIYVSGPKSGTILRDISDLLRKFDLNSLKIVPTAHEIKLKIIDEHKIFDPETKKKTPVEYTVLTYACTDSDLCTRVVNISEDISLSSFETAWIKNQPLHQLMFLEIVKCLIEDPGKIELMFLDTQALTHILRTHVTRLLEQKGFIQTTGKITEIVEPQIQVNVAEALKQFSKDLIITKEDINLIEKLTSEIPPSEFIYSEEELMASVEEPDERELIRKGHKMHGTYEFLTEDEKIIAKHSQLLQQTLLEGLLIDASDVKLYQVKDERVKMRTVLTFHRLAESFINYMETELTRSLARFGRGVYQTLDDPLFVRVFEFLLEKKFELEVPVVQTARDTLSHDIEVIAAQMGAGPSWAQLAEDEEVEIELDESEQESIPELEKSDED
uniref:RNA-dependent RNA polymerase n=1 Tax=Jingmen ascaridia virus 1 TaxID=1923346 RepID=A0A1L3KPF0_9VIRU|nr:RNA-dependent RNA polymerase [Jingmen ascaridia virus 1]